MTNTWCDFHGIDSNGFAVQVDKRPSGVSEGDGSVGLNVLRHVPVPQAKFRPGSDGADDAGGDVVGERERAAHGDHELAGTDVVGGAQGHRGEILAGNAHRCEVGFDVHVLHDAREDAAILQFDLSEIYDFKSLLGTAI